MTETERLIYKDHVQSLAISVLQNATVQASIVEGGVRLTVIFDILGETTFHVCAARKSTVIASIDTSGSL